ncbi:YggT family protein [Tepidiforma thermophila]|uniref:YggT family protein n=1 Tax=Tepidiforma thermophila (strain KCTC 52669 / CGMCC 1.13589 / G233) TaxID=2761530 RepID=A0A2A9HJ03_TEPT2|nr:YggT family protein [Tepidiforma thermophila]
MKGATPGGRAINPYVAQLTFTFLNILTWAIIARALLSWLPIDQSSPLYQLLFRVTEPIIDPFRRVIPRAGMIDLSPMMAILALLVMQQLVAMLVVPA